MVFNPVNEEKELMLEKIEYVAQEAVEEGGKIVRNYFGKSLDVLQVEFKVEDGDTPRMIIDRESSLRMLGIIRSAFSDDIIYEEETGYHPGKGRIWYVDPFDGTANSLRNLPWSTVGLAVEEDGQLIVTCAYHPFENILYSAVRNMGAMSFSFSNELLDSKKLIVSREQNPAKKFVFIDALFKSSNTKSKIGFMEDIVKLAHNVRITSSSIDYGARLASGAADIILIDCVGGFWDVACGVLLAREAGGIVTDIYGNEPRPGVEVVVGSSMPEEHYKILEIAQKHYKNYKGFRS